MSNEIIPLNDIDEKARDIAVAWIEELCPGQGMQLHQKHKLASDIMNYHREKAQELLDKTVKEKRILKSMLCGPRRFEVEKAVNESDIDVVSIIGETNDSGLCVYQVFYYETPKF